jgi:hypothetical protein
LGATRPDLILQIEAKVAKLKSEGIKADLLGEFLNT